MARASRVIGGVLILLLLGGGWLAIQALSTGVAYKAKTLCSGVFVSKRDRQAVLAELHADDLAILKYIGASIDPAAKQVTASLAGLVSRRATYRDGLGCALVLDGITPPSLQGQQHAGPVSRPRDPAGSPDGSAASRAAHGPPTDALAAAVARAFSEPDPAHRSRTQAVVVMQHGHVIAERYAEGIHPDTPLAGWSMTKSVMNALAGILVRQGRLALDAPVPIPEWGSRGDPRGAITLDHLLRMSSGLRFDEGMSNPRSDVMRMLFGLGDMAAFATSKDLVSPPGTAWHYSSGTSNILSRVFRNVLGDEGEYLAWPRRALFDRLGMSSAVLETDAAGTFVGSSYMYGSARDWARFGTLYLQDGVWDGERILPEGWVAYTRTPAPADPAKRYGAHFWLQVPDEYAGTDARVPVDAFHAAGHEAQFVTIVPAYELVIVRLGRTRQPEGWDHPAFVRDILASLGGNGR